LSLFKVPSAEIMVFDAIAKHEEGRVITAFVPTHRCIARSPRIELSVSQIDRRTRITR
jgi:hypothetical protein